MWLGDFRYLLHIEQDGMKQQFSALAELSAAESLGENAVAQVSEALQDGASGTPSEREEPGAESGRMH